MRCKTRDEICEFTEEVRRGEDGEPSCLKGLVHDCRVCFKYEMPAGKAGDERRLVSQTRW